MATETDTGRIFEQRVEPVGERRLERDGAIVANGGVATLYKWKSTGLTVDGAAAAISSASSSALRDGPRPAAPCGVANTASHAALQTAGLFPCAQLLSGALAPA